MTEAITWLRANQVELMALAGAAYALLCIVVRLTPTKRDDEALAAAHAFFIRAAVLVPRDFNAGVVKLPGAMPKRDPYGDRK